MPMELQSICRRNKVIKKKGSDWLEVSKSTHKGLFSEIHLLMMALDKFFKWEKFYPKNTLAIKNFYNELTVVRDVILRILAILEVVIPESRKNAYWFQKYTETKFLGDKRIEMFKQDTPEKSLYLLYDSFINLKSIVTDLLRNTGITYISFINIGNVISKHIRDNVFFNPFKKDINHEFDVIENHKVSEIVREIKEVNVKKPISLIFLQIFRFLRYLGHVDLTTPRYVALHSSLIILLLLRFEIEVFLTFIERSTANLKNRKLKELLQALSYQFSMETKRVYLQELKDILEKKSPQQIRGRIENSHGILKNLTEQAIIQIAQFFSPLIKDEELFPSLVTRVEQSLKLREDIYVLYHIIGELSRNSYDTPKKISLFNSLRNFMEYFESFTFRLLRYDDYEEFKSFFEEMENFSLEEDDFEKLIEKCQHFKIFLETTLRHIENRAELRGKPIDTEKAGAVLGQYLQ